MEEKQTLGIGRPKKTPPISIDYFHRVTNIPETSTSIMEFRYTDPFGLKKFLQTMKSNHIDKLWITFKRDSISFNGNMELKSIDDNIFENNNSGMILTIDCNKVFHYFCRKSFIILINKKKFISTLISEISEASREITFQIDENSPGKIFVDIRNSVLRATLKNFFDYLPVDPREERLSFKQNTEKFCEIMNIDIGEFKKNLTTKIKKKVNETKLTIGNNTLSILFKIDISRTMDLIYEDNYELYEIEDEKIKQNSKNKQFKKNKQIIKFYNQSMMELNFPKENITSFLLHIKGEFDIEFGNNSIILQYSNGNDITLYSFLKTEHN